VASLSQSEQQAALCSMSAYLHRHSALQARSMAAASEILEKCLTGSGCAVKKRLRKQFFALTCLCLGMASMAAAQDSTLPSFGAISGVSGGSLASRMTSSTSLQPLGNTLSLPSLAVPHIASSLPEPRPRSAYDDEDNSRFELGLSFALVRFRSSPINATMGGPSTTVGYHVTQGFVVEGVFTTVFGSKIFDQEHTKYLFAGGGPKITFGNGKWRPFVHGDFGLVHMLPQTAGNSQKGFGAQVGGGAELHLNPVWSLRFGGDFVRAQVYPGGQNNLQVTIGILYHFK
jgi:opacity protein-like surface antigen